MDPSTTSLAVDNPGGGREPLLLSEEEEEEIVLTDAEEAQAVCVNRCLTIVLSSSAAGMACGCSWFFFIIMDFHGIIMKRIPQRMFLPANEMVLVASWCSCCLSWRAVT